MSSKLRERILRESAELGYHGPNFAARSLRKGESGVVGIMLTDSLSYGFSDPVANQLLQGISEILVEHNKQMMLLSSHAESQQQSIAESLPDGFIIYGAPSGTTYERIKRAGKPIIAVDYLAEGTSTVNIDDEQGAFTVAMHLLEGNKSNIAVLGLKLIDSNRIGRLTEEDLRTEAKEVSHVRLKGYIRAAKTKELSIKPEQVWHIPVNTHQSAEIAAREALTQSPMPDVLLCMSDVIALAAIRVAINLGIKVPEEVSIAGFDDIPEAARSMPSLTTVCQQSLDKGRIAARLLLEESEQKHVVLKTRLVIRESSVSKSKH